MVNLNVAMQFLLVGYPIIDNARKNLIDFQFIVKGLIILQLGSDLECLGIELFL